MLPVNSIAIYPNPANDVLHIETSAGIHFIHIYNMLGSEVWNEKVSGRLHTIHLGALPTGTYVIEVKKEGTVTREN